LELPVPQTEDIKLRVVFSSTSTIREMYRELIPVYILRQTTVRS
jgi:hypothetical protein